MDIPKRITDIASAISFVLTTEGAAAFDDLTRSVRTQRSVAEHLAERIPHAPLRPRRRIHPCATRPDAADARNGHVHGRLRHPAVADRKCHLGVTNLTGHPAIALKAGFVDHAPVELMLTGRLYEEATLLSGRAGVRTRDAVAHETEPLRYVAGSRQAVTGNWLPVPASGRAGRTGS